MPFHPFIVVSLRRNLSHRLTFAGRSSRAHRREGQHFYSGEERRRRAGSGSHHRRRSLRRQKRCIVIPLEIFLFYRTELHFHVHLMNHLLAVVTPRCIRLLVMVTSISAACSSIAEQMSMQKISGATRCKFLFYRTELQFHVHLMNHLLAVVGPRCIGLLVLVTSISAVCSSIAEQMSPRETSAAAPRARRSLSLTPCAAVLAALRSNGPSNGKRPTLLGICAASAARSDARALRHYSLRL